MRCPTTPAGEQHVSLTFVDVYDFYSFIAVPMVATTMRTVDQMMAHSGSNSMTAAFMKQWILSSPKQRTFFFSAVSLVVLAR
jgi:hypothetical protein